MHCCRSTTFFGQDPVGSERATFATTPMHDTDIQLPVINVILTVSRLGCAYQQLDCAKCCTLGSGYSILTVHWWATMPNQETVVLFFSNQNDSTAGAVQSLPLMLYVCIDSSSVIIYVQLWPKKSNPRAESSAKAHAAAAALGSFMMSSKWKRGATFDPRVGFLWPRLTRLYMLYGHECIYLVIYPSGRSKYNRERKRKGYPEREREREREITAL